MWKVIFLFGFAGLAAAGGASAEGAQRLIAEQLQQLSDAISNGDAGVWDRYLDPSCVYVAEDGTVSTKAQMLSQVVPLPKGISGVIKVEIDSYHEQGDVAVAVFRQHETENYFGQTLHAEYLATATWGKRGGDWKLLAQQTLAEQIDPPAIAIAAARAAEYAGAYRLKGSDVTYQVTADGGKLSGTRAGHPPVELNAEAPDVFFVAGAPRIRKIFQRDASGHITGFVDRREGRDVVWVRLP
jgi:Domain of unknown function (DUF4440)